MDLHGCDILQGRVVDITEGGSKAETYAVVEVEGVAGPLIVALDRIRGLM